MNRRTCFTVFLAGCLSAASAGTYYVDASRSNDTGAGTSWAAAKKTIQAAVNLASAGDTVLVTNGTYNSGTTVTPGGTLKNRVVVTKAITVSSVNGAAATFIEGSGTNYYGTASAVRCVFVTNGVFDGFTLWNGATSNDYNSAINSSGGGAFACGATIRNCTLTGNTASCGGGSAYGFVTNCTLTGSSASSLGGGSYYGTLANCMLSGNSASSGGGSCYGTLANCTLSGNAASYCGGGSCSGTLKNCTLTGNTASYEGGGAFYGTLRTSIAWGNANG